MNERVLALRDAVVKITQMLSGKGIEVTQRGVNAYVKADAAGRPVQVNLPYLPDNATEDLVNAIQGFLDHEVAHILFSDFNLTSKAGKMGVHSMFNIVEDARIEKLMAQKFTGSGHNLSVTGKFFLDKFTVPSVRDAQASGDTNKVIGILMVPLIRAMSGQFIFKEFMKDKMGVVAPVHDRIKDLEPRIEACSTCAEALEIALEIEKRLKSGSKGTGEGEEGDGLGAGKLKGKAKKGKGKGGTGKGKSKSKAAGESEGEEEGEEAGSEPGEGEGEDEEESAGGAGEGEDEGGEGAGAGEGEDDEGAGRGSGEEDGEDEDEGGAGEEGGPGEQPEEMTTGCEAAILSAIDKENANGYDAAISTLISNAAVDLTKDSPYIIFSKEADVVEPLHVGGGYQPRMFKDLSEKVDHMVGPLQKDLERAISARSLATWEAGRRSGRLHAANLSRLAVGDPRVFRVKHESTSKDVAVELVIDASGSMSGGKIHLAAQSAYALASVLERLNIPNEVIAFTTGPIPRNSGEVEESERKLGRRYSRQESLYMPVIKTFQERLRTEVKDRFGWLPNSQILRNNIDGECVEIAARRLTTRREAGKVMIVLSDGAPACLGDSGGLQRHLKKVVKDVESTGIKVVGIGINSSEVQKFYSRNIVINNVGELPTRVIKELRHMLLN